MIEVERLTKDYGTVVAVRELSFTVKRGEVVGFLGPNGAGKSTTLRILTGFLGPSSGRVRVNGFDVLERPFESRRSLGYLPEASPLYPELRVSEYLWFRAALKRVPRRQRAQAVRRAMELAGVVEVADTLVLHLSRGYRQRVGIADALVSNPPLLVLDEPTAGLDPNQIRGVRRLIRELGREHTILVSTHILSEVEATCDRAIVIHRGRLVAEGSIEQLLAGRRGTSAELRLRDPGGVALGLASTVAGVRSARAESTADGTLRLLVDSDEDTSGPVLERLVAALVAAGVGVREVAPARASLEDVFALLTDAGPPVAAAGADAKRSHSAPGNVATAAGGEGPP